MAPEDKFKQIIGRIISGKNPLTEIDIHEQFCPHEKDDISILRNLNSAFLIALTGKSHELYREADEYINKFSNSDKWGNAASFYTNGIELIYNEVKDQYSENSEFQDNINGLLNLVHDSVDLTLTEETKNAVMKVFFPEGAFSKKNKDVEVSKLRDKRKVIITQLNDNPIKRPEKEILFTSNVLLTTPPANSDIEELDTSDTIKEILKDIVNEKQVYWYDHPVQIGTPPENNEILYGITKFNEALQYEEEHGYKDINTNLNFLLSVSVTHKGLRSISKKYIEAELKKSGSSSERMNIYVFTEKDTDEILNDVLIPFAEHYMDDVEKNFLDHIFGVDGEYGRHYCFLKAIALFWNVFISQEIRGTFKIDLDQIFKQGALVKETGLTAFQHFQTPLWGANGTDSSGDAVHLGMIAGALVNEKDQERSIFTPDVKFPEDKRAGDCLIFDSAMPQALSTEGEIQTRYNDDSHINGEDTCIQRIHVTGGTNGILIDSLKKYNPFTPSFFGRAEDQAYLMSVLFEQGDTGYLRYVHKDGLIMRHDKEAFAGGAIKAAKTGKLIGDYVRILLFSYYADALPWHIEKIKSILDPFTGCFISRIPYTVVYLRFALKAAGLFMKDDDSASGFISMGVKRLNELIVSLSSSENPLLKKYNNEYRGWKIYFDILKKAEEEILKGDPFVMELKNRARSIIDKCLVKV